MPEAFSRAVSGFGQKNKTCRPAPDEAPRKAEKISGPQGRSKHDSGQKLQTSFEPTFL